MTWIWVLLAFMAGSFFGLILAAVLAANTASIRKEWWKDDE